MKFFALVVISMMLFGKACSTSARADERPNILLCVADDWGWPHAGAYGDPVVKTPTFDRIAREGVLFEHAYVSSPSCTPSRSSILTGQYHWRLGCAANLHGQLDTKHKTFSLLLQNSGYFCGHSGKGWGPGKTDNWQRTGQETPAGKKFPSFDRFLDQWPRDRPFCFWLGSHDPHRDYQRGSGEESGMDLSQIKLFDHFPDSMTIRADVADYYFEVQRFDSLVGAAMDRLEALAVLENTLVVMTSDHGMPFPRGKANLYDSGTRVPMAIYWPKLISPARNIIDFVSTTELAPTFLEIAGVTPPPVMTGCSWMKIFRSHASGRIEPTRDHVIFGKERHVACQQAPESGGTPMRAIRTDQFLLIHNYLPDRWPAGTPDYEQAYLRGSWYGDCDNGPTKTYMIENEEKDAEHRQKFALSFGKRPEFELYDLSRDPAQMINVADENRYQQVKTQLLQQLDRELVLSKDPRAISQATEFFDRCPYHGGTPKYFSYRKTDKQKLPKRDLATVPGRL